jgi:hypothetical protein
VPWYSKSHPITPKLYVQPWTQDIVNRTIIIHVNIFFKIYFTNICLNILSLLFKYLKYDMTNLKILK